MYLGKVSLFDA